MLCIRLLMLHWVLPSVVILCSGAQRRQDDYKCSLCCHILALLATQSGYGIAVLLYVIVVALLLLMVYICFNNY